MSVTFVVYAVMRPLLSRDSCEGCLFDALFCGGTCEVALRQAVGDVSSLSLARLSSVKAICWYLNRIATYDYFWNRTLL